MKLTLASFMCAVLSFLGIVSAHGYVLDPPARNYLCTKAEGHWWPEDGSGVPNLACRAAYQVTKDPLLYTQVHEYAINIADYRSQAAVEASVLDGLLCSGGQTRYRGMSTAHPQWQKTSVPAAGGRYTLTYSAVVPHDPSFFEVYLTKPGFDSRTQTLKWRDLQRLGAFENLPLKRSAGGSSYYEITVALPADRARGDSAILFTRWQRIDNAGEGFYSCSDIVFGGGAPSTPMPPAPTPTPPTSPTPPTPPAPTPTPPTSPAPKFKVAFKAQQAWNGGFNGVTNGGMAVNNWVLSFKLANGAGVGTTVWGAGGAISSHHGGTVSIVPNTWGGSRIGAGETVKIYYGGTGVHKGAESCTINGRSCE